MRLIPPSVPGLKPIPEAAFELGGLRGDELAAELRKDGVAVFEFKVGRSIARLVRPDEYAQWLARRAGAERCASSEPAPDGAAHVLRDVVPQLERQAEALHELKLQVQALLAKNAEVAK